VAAGIYDDVESACKQTIHLTGSTKPGENTAVYPPYYERYRALYPALAPEFQAIAGL
jgi:hypothetical protein